MIVKDAKFLRAVSRAADAPRPPRPAAIFAGRSNAGKSSLINAIVGVKGLAKTSSTPGRTREIVYFEVNAKWHFIDLPGYGYAAVPERIRREWGPMVERFLREAEGVRLAVVVLDARRDPSPEDHQLVGWLESIGLPRLFAATKIDKLKRGDAKARLAAIREALGGEGRARVIPFSAETGEGKRELWGAISAALEAERGTRDEGQGKRDKG